MVHQRLGTRGILIDHCVQRPIDCSRQPRGLIKSESRQSLTHLLGNFAAIEARPLVRTRPAGGLVFRFGLRPWRVNGPPVACPCKLPSADRPEQSTLLARFEDGERQTENAWIVISPEYGAAVHARADQMPGDMLNDRIGVGFSIEPCASDRRALSSDFLLPTRYGDILALSVERCEIDQMRHQFFTMGQHTRRTGAHIQCREVRRMEEHGGFNQQKAPRQRRGGFVNGQHRLGGCIHRLRRARQTSDRFALRPAQPVRRDRSRGI